VKPGHLVRVGDRLTLRFGKLQRKIEILALGERRGSASDARLLCADTDAPVPLADSDEKWVSLFDESDAELTSNRSLSR
jgi:ribosomal 50S subunit-recycling heat shock protein